MLKVLFLNGPPGCGKDEVVRIADKLPFYFMHRKFAAPLKVAACDLLGCTLQELEEMKRSDPRVRTVLIALSEKVIKPLYGHEFFGRRLAMAMPSSGNVIVSDSGFTVELKEFKEALRRREIKTKLRLWRIERPECTFANDSREWVFLDSVQDEVIHNTGTLEHFERIVTNRLMAYFG